MAGRRGSFQQRAPTWRRPAGPHARPGAPPARPHLAARARNLTSRRSLLVRRHRGRLWAGSAAPGLTAWRARSPLRAGPGGDREGGLGRPRGSARCRDGRLCSPRARGQRGRAARRPGLRSMRAGARPPARQSGRRGRGLESETRLGAESQRAPPADPAAGGKVRRPAGEVAPGAFLETRPLETGFHDHCEMRRPSAPKGEPFPLGRRRRMRGDHRTRRSAARGGRRGSRPLRFSACERRASLQRRGRSD